jgi:hypothetical protein
MKKMYRKITLLCIGFTFLSLSNVMAQKVSDVDLKINVQAIESPLKKILSLEPKSFEFNQSKFKHLQLHAGKHFGFINDDVKNIFPSLISDQYIKYAEGKNRYKDAVISKMDNDDLVPVLVAAIKELHAEIEQLKKQIEQLKK